jgi:hypothetical protein
VSSHYLDFSSARTRLLPAGTLRAKALRVPAEELPGMKDCGGNSISAAEYLSFQEREKASWHHEQRVRRIALRVFFLFLEKPQK